MRRTFLTTGSPQTEDGRYYILQNWRQDPAVTITDAGVQVERAHFSPYGRVLGMPAGDTDFDFSFDSDDQDLDGDVDSDDATANTTVTMGWDVISSVGSKVGYAGYVQDAYVPTVSHVRYRVLKVDLGRWLQRDTAGYIDGANLYELLASSPISTAAQNTGEVALMPVCGVPATDLFDPLAFITCLVECLGLDTIPKDIKDILKGKPLTRRQFLRLIKPIIKKVHPAIGAIELAVCVCKCAF